MPGGQSLFSPDGASPINTTKGDKEDEPSARSLAGADGHGCREMATGVLTR